MSARLPEGGRLIDRSQPLSFSFNGRKLQGYAGDTLASALLANGQTLAGRSFKYHRPRGIVASGPEEPNALMNLGQGGRFEPNARATTTELFEGLEAKSQNHWPSLEFDIGAVNTRLAAFLPAGFYYKTFLRPRAAWKHLFEPLIRRSAGLGRAPTEPDVDRYEQLYAYCDVLVAGGGIAGLQAARAAADAGARVILMEQAAHWGGRAPVDGVEFGAEPAESWVRETVAALSARENVTLRLRACVAGLYDHGYAIAAERLNDHDPAREGPRQRLWRIRAGQVIVATGAIERPLAFAGNDLPGILLASATRDYVSNWGVAPGARVLIVANNDDAYRTAFALKAAGLDVPAIVDARAEPSGDLPQKARDDGFRMLVGMGIAEAVGKKQVEAARLCPIGGEGTESGETIACDTIAMSGGWSPAVHLWSHAGGKLSWDAKSAFFRPDPARAPTGADGAAMAIAAGAAEGALHAAQCLASGHGAGRQAARVTGYEPKGQAPGLSAPREGALEPVWIMPRKAAPKLRAKMWLDFQNDVKVSDIELAQREGYESVEHAKRYTTLGMATDQGKLSNINGLAILAEARGIAIPEVGTTTFRPPYQPVPLGTLAGEARGAIFQPIRRTPIHDWHESHGAHFEPVGLWRRPYCYSKQGESHAQAVDREVKAVRAGLGLLDASTLGKILVKGPDAGRFLNMLYTGTMSTLAVGKCRYGLMCNENGFLSDDGVVARLAEDTFLCHTTSGGADRIHGHMEDWLQCEWWDWKVYTQNLTEEYAQIAVVGPKARAVLEKIGGMDVSHEAFPFMEWREGVLGGIPARVFRISFSGELSYEIAVPAAHGMVFWERLLREGAEFGATPYGTEALHVMRAEKGFIMIGDETDGTVIPQDLGLDWAISKKKADYIGKRAQERIEMARGTRWRLVGLETADGSVLPEGAYVLGEGINANGQKRVQGRVTSTYFSPTLGRGIAMALIEKGPERMGESVRVQGGTGGPVAAKIASPVFYDAKGERQNV